MIKLSKACLLLVYLDFYLFISKKIEKGTVSLVTGTALTGVCQVGVGWVTFLRENKDLSEYALSCCRSWGKDGVA